MILEWRHPLPVETPHGEGIALLYIDRGADLNPEYHVRLRGGHVKNYYSPDIRLVGNPMDGHGWDVDLPAEWKTPPDSPQKTPIASIWRRFLALFA